MPSPVAVLRPRTPLRAPRPGSVSRPRLVRRLAAGADAAVATIVAPAGYGKTTLLAEWEASDPRPFTWISACDDAAPLLAALPRSPFVLVLDDAHAVRSATALRALTTIARHLPAGSQLALASRGRPGLPLGRLRAQGELVELGAADLAMTPREAAVLLRRAGLRLSDGEMETIMRRTEGWPAGLYLAACVLLAQDDVPAAVERFAGDDRIVADYLRDEVLDGLDPDAVAFLRHTSPLEELSGPLCDAVLGRHGSGRVLRDLARSSAFISALDRSEEHFRAHPLLADSLRTDLRAGQPECERELHRRASAWYARRADLDRAIGHAAEAGDAAAAGALLWDLAGTYAAEGRFEEIGRWLALFGETEIREHPELALSAALHRCAVGRRGEAERFVAAAERGSDAAGLAAVRAMLALDGVARMGEDAARAFALDADGRWRTVARLLEGVAAHLTGARDESRAALEAGAHRGAPGIRSLCRAQLALLAAEEDDWPRAAELADAALADVAATPLATAPTTGLVHAAGAFARAHRGRAEEARGDVRAARLLLGPEADYAPWFGTETRIALARAELRLGNAAEARTLLAEASRLLHRTPDAPVLQAWMDEAWACSDAFAASAASALTTAELRVLRFLPSHLSLREIAARLHVSANTVKTQAHAVYRKLDASSRSEAVSCAREAGLIDG
jgi:LuxR family transcriptional regulator, maltose regulon positive regulatory protein